MVSRVLALYYLLSFEYFCDQEAKKNSNNNNRRLRHEYSAALWTNVPIRYLLAVVERQVDNYAVVRSSLIR